MGVRRRIIGNMNRTEWTAATRETKDKPKCHNVKEEEGTGGEQSVVRSFKILNGNFFI
jgi:type IV secretory pathway VirD2 relaxase